MPGMLTRRYTYRDRDVGKTSGDLRDLDVATSKPKPPIETSGRISLPTTDYNMEGDWGELGQGHMGELGQR